MWNMCHCLRPVHVHVVALNCYCNPPHVTDVPFSILKDPNSAIYNRQNVKRKYNSDTGASNMLMNCVMDDAQHFEVTYCLHPRGAFILVYLTLANEGNIFLRNVRNHLPNNAVLHPRRLDSSLTPLWKTSKPQNNTQMEHICACCCCPCNQPCPRNFVPVHASLILYVEILLKHYQHGNSSGNYICVFWFQWPWFCWQCAGKFRGPCA
jgi:hypothetical protein